MVETIIEHGHEKLRFSSKEEMVEAMRQNLEREFHLKFENEKVIPKPTFEEFFKSAKRGFDMDVEQYWGETLRRGSIWPFSLESCARRTASYGFDVHRIPHDSAAKDAIWRAKQGFDASASSSPDASSSYTSAEPKKPAGAPRWLLLSAAGAGGVLTIHGALAAATAVDHESKQRDWRKTALHTVEALAGVAVSWVSVVALRKLALTR